eukprot:4557739-Prymnesium_polylepis.1
MLKKPRVRSPFTAGLQHVATLQPRSERRTGGDRTLEGHSEHRVGVEHYRISPLLLMFTARTPKIAVNARIYTCRSSVRTHGVAHRPHRCRTLLSYRTWPQQQSQTMHTNHTPAPPAANLPTRRKPRWTAKCRFYKR